MASNSHRNSSAAFQQAGLAPRHRIRRARRRHAVARSNCGTPSSDDAHRTHAANFAIAFERQILAGCPDAVVIGADADRLPHTSNIAFVGLDRQALFMALDQAGVACSTGSACASGSSEPSPALLAMGLDRGRNFERSCGSVSAPRRPPPRSTKPPAASSVVATTCGDENTADFRPSHLPPATPIRVKFRACEFRPRPALVPAAQSHSDWSVQ